MNTRTDLIRFLRFAAVGAVGTIAHYALLLVMVEVLGASPLAGAATGFMLGAAVNYSLSRLLVFDSDRTHVEAIPRFLLVAAIGLALTALLMTLFVDLFGLHYLLAQLVTTALLLLWHYAGNALWTFSRKARANGP